MIAAAVTAIPTQTVLADLLARPAPKERWQTVSLALPDRPQWMEMVERQISELSSLPFGWDAFGAGPIRRDVLWFALWLLDSAMLDDTSPPHITPMSHDGIMLEWHRKGIDLEIEIERPGEAHISYEDAATGTDESWTIGTDVSSLTNAIERITGLA